MHVIQTKPWSDVWRHRSYVFVGWRVLSIAKPCVWWGQTWITSGMVHPPKRLPLVTAQQKHPRLLAIPIRDHQIQKEEAFVVVLWIWSVKTHIKLIGFRLMICWSPNIAFCQVFSPFRPLRQCSITCLLNHGVTGRSHLNCVLGRLFTARLLLLFPNRPLLVVTTCFLVVFAFS